MCQWLSEFFPIKRFIFNINDKQKYINTTKFRPLLSAYIARQDL